MDSTTTTSTTTTRVATFQKAVLENPDVTDRRDPATGLLYHPERSTEAVGTGQMGCSYRVVPTAGSSSRPGRSGRARPAGAPTLTESARPGRPNTSETSRTCTDAATSRFARRR